MKTELKSICEIIKPASEERMRAARVHLDHVAKPLKALGRLEDVLVRLAGMAELRRDYRKCAVVMCADNGVVAEGVTQTGSDVTAVVAGNILNGKASVCCMAGVAGAEVLAVDIGMLADVPGVRNCKVAYGTKNFRHGPAMTKEEAQTAVMHGVNVARELAENGFSMLSAGEMGIGNTTSSSAVASVLLGRAPAEMTGRGAGLSSLQLQNKIRVIEDALACNAPDPDDPLDVLAKVGGFDIAGMCGLFLGGDSGRHRRADFLCLGTAGQEALSRLCGLHDCLPPFGGACGGIRDGGAGPYPASRYRNGARRGNGSGVRHAAYQYGASRIL